MDSLSLWNLYQNLFRKELKNARKCEITSTVAPNTIIDRKTCSLKHINPIWNYNFRAIHYLFIPLRFVTRSFNFPLVAKYNLYT